MDIFDSYYLLFVILLAAYLGIEGDRRKWYGPISGAIITILFTSVLTSLGAIPTAGDPEVHVGIYQVVYDFVVPLSIPLLLWHANLKRIFRKAGKLSLLFLIGSVGIVIGALVANGLVNLGAEHAKIAGVYVATYTGGSVNFMSAAKTLDFLESATFASVITIDNVFTSLFFVMLFAVPSIKWLASKYRTYREEDTQDGSTTTADPLPHDPRTPMISAIATALFVASMILLLGRYSDQLIRSLINTSISLEILLVTIYAVALTNIFDTFFSKIAEDGFQIGMFLLYVFLAVIGAACDLPKLVSASPVLLIFVIITLLVHLIITLLGGYLLKFSLEETLIASAANAGGPSISAAMASSFNMKSGMTPAVLIGILGYVVGTFLGVGVGLFLQ